MYDVRSLADAPVAPADYESIFNERGDAYHQAMLEFPDARNEEFREVVRLVDPRPGQTLCDAPSGGGYLRRHLACADCEVIAIETSETFHRLCTARGDYRAILSRLDRIDLPDASVDGLLSLAGAHHLPDRGAFFREAHRILKLDGPCCVADVREGTNVARFLNVFVDRCNSMGHRGDFLGANAGPELEAAGFTMQRQYYRAYPWTFASIEAMTRCVTLLFGLDRARPAEVLEGIGEYLGYERADGVVRMNWGLLFLRGVKKRPT